MRRCGAFRRRVLTARHALKALADLGSPRPLVLNVAVTGHRAAALTAEVVRSLRPIVFLVFRQLREAALSLQQSETGLCSDTAAELRLHTPLATGADQIAAICARSSGYFVRALLPFEASEYRKDFADGDELETFDQALAAADEIVALPGQRADVETAYLVVGESLVETADLLVAIWDGDPARGPGGTANVVDLALKSATPVIHLRVDHGSNEVHMRALIDGDATRPFGASIHDSQVYGQVLRGALGLDPAPRPEREAVEVA